jgi:hypothetical protein
MPNKKIIMTKKRIVILKTKFFFDTYPILLFVQHNNLSIKEWSQLRLALKALKNINLYGLKNSIAANFINTYDTTNKYKSIFIFQGPCAVIGCLQQSDLRNVISILNSIPKLIIVGAIYNKEIYTHLDISKLCTLDSSVYVSVLQSLQLSKNLSSQLESYLRFVILQQVTKKLLNCLDSIKHTKR